MYSVSGAVRSTVIDQQISTISSTVVLAEVALLSVFDVTKPSSRGKMLASEICYQVTAWQPSLLLTQSEMSIAKVDVSIAARSYQ